MNKEYQKLTEQFTEDIFNNAAEQTNSAYVQQNKDQEQLLNMIAKILLSYTIIDSVLSIGNNDRKSLNNKFKIAISDIVKDQFNTEKDLVKEVFATAAKDKYYTDAYITQIGIDFNLQKITDDEIAKVVNGSIDNKLWSDRLWNNKKGLEDKLKKEVDSFLKGKTNVNQIEKAVKKQFNQNAYNTHRLVQTEVARCQSNANDIFAEKHGIEYQLFTATLDNKTSEKCRSYDGKVFDIDDNNKPIPPLHPFCRSCLINIPYKDWKPTERVDNITKEKIPYMDYEDWYKEKVANNPSFVIDEKKTKNRAIDKRQYEKYKGILGKDLPVKGVDEFQELKYNGGEGWDNLKEYFSYKTDNPESDKKYFLIDKKIQKLRNDGIIKIKGTVVKPTWQPIKELNGHTLIRMNERDINKEDVQSFIDNSFIAFKQRKGTQYAYYSDKGFTAITTDGIVGSTGWIDKNAEIMIKEIKKIL